MFLTTNGMIGTGIRIRNTLPSDVAMLGWGRNYMGDQEGYIREAWRYGWWRPWLGMSADAMMSQDFLYESTEIIN